MLVIICDRVQAMLRKGATPIASRSADVLTMAETTPVVFIVDDDISVRESLELLLKSDGWRCASFASAQEFLSRPRATVPGCLVLDVVLPGLNGLEATPMRH
jgi:PleD family two-component response regulator